MRLIRRVGKLEMFKIKPGSHRRIIKDNRSKTGKDQEILSESG